MPRRLLRLTPVAFALAGLAQPAQAQNAASTARETCRPDIQRLCSDAQPGQALRSCLRQNIRNLSPACRTALSEVASQRRNSAR